MAVEEHEDAGDGAAPAKHFAEAEALAGSTSSDLVSTATASGVAESEAPARQISDHGDSVVVISVAERTEAPIPPVKPKPRGVNPLAAAAAAATRTARAMGIRNSGIDMTLVLPGDPTEVGGFIVGVGGLVFLFFIFG